MIKVGINASFLRKQNTGIGQVSINFLRKLMEISNDKEVEFVLYLEEDVDFDLADGFSKRVFLPVYKRDDLIRKIWWEKFSLPRRIKKDKCDVLLSLYQSTTTVQLHMGVKHIMIVHDIIPRLFPEYLNNWRKKLYQWLTERAIKKVDKIIAVSHRTEKDLIAHLGIDAKKITVSYIDVDEIYKKEVSEKESQRILKKYNLEAGYIYSGGGLEIRKNTENILRAYKILFEAYGHASWLPKVVVSGKMMPELAPLVTDVSAAVKGLGLEKEVSLLGFVAQEDLPALYKNASVFVYPSLYEGFGLPVLEAMSQGTPVITSKTSSLPEVGSDSVVYCNPKSVDDLAMVMKNVLMNNHLLGALSLKGKERSTHFSWDKFTEKMMNIIINEKYK
ncbi:MAG: Glycosyl transferase group 1 [Parcubacteria group bacterium GW2011_GWD2_38_11]|nr:MAG: Glycosyl transferase group 1 [Parcubacteria group bacterium GW2011_GWD2_38_11]